MTDQYKNMMIALFVCAAAGVITFILLFIHPNVGNEEKTLYVRFIDIDKINVGTRVTYGGKPVGEVIAIREITGEKGYRHTYRGRVYPYELELHVDSGIQIFNSDEITARTSGLLGEKSVAIIPLPPLLGMKLSPIDGEVVYATEVGSVEDTFKDFKTVANKLEVALDNINRALEQMEGDKTFTSIARIANNIADITEALHKPKEISETVESFHYLITEASAAWQRVDPMLDSLCAIANHVQDITAVLDQPERLEEIVDNVYQVSSGARTSWPAINSGTNQFAAAMERMKSIIDYVDQGEGTIGRLLMHDELYLNLTALLNKGEVIANDINHYGLLFHLDKKWQRLRARRLNLLAQLSTPQQFRNYFNDEVDQITTSLSRVHMAMEKNTGLSLKGRPLDDKRFGKVYAELLRRVEGMEEMLKMYNQQLVDEQTYTTELVPAAR